MKSQKEKAKRNVSSFSAKLFFPMMILIILQIATLFGTLYISGEFRSVRQYSYDMLIEKTKNRKNYIENMFKKNIPEVYQTNIEVTSIVENILSERQEKIEEITTDKELNKEMIMSVTQPLIYLLRVSGANDAFIIFDSGELYARNGINYKSCVYIRDNDSSTNSTSKNDDLLLEAGSSDVSKNFNIALDYEWAAQVNVGECDSEDKVDFFHRTIETARLNGGTNLSELGYWSDFSKITDSAPESIKYTLPLVSSDGTVYGVIGIGFLEKNVLKSMPKNRDMSENSCYAVCADFNGDNNYSVLMSYGAMFSRLVEDTETIHMDGTESNEIYDIGRNSIEQSVGSIQQMYLYSDESPYVGEQWALISIAEKEQTLSVYTRLIKMLVISIIVSVIFTFFVALLIDKIVTTPVKKIVRELGTEYEGNKIIRFDSSGIAEVDTLTKAIEILQVNINEQASRVSKIISMVNMGIGVFMCNLDTMEVYVGESLIKLLDFKALPVADTNIKFNTFRAYISDYDPEGKVCGSDIFDPEKDVSNEEIKIKYYDDKKNITLWYEFTMKKDGNKILGLV